MLWALAIAWWLYETAWFGWNATPSGPEELICDGIVFVLTAIAIHDHRRRGATITVQVGSRTGGT